MDIGSNFILYINIGILILFIALIIIGYSKGFLLQLLSLLYTIASLTAAWFLSPVLAEKYPIIHLDKINSEYKLISEFLHLDNIINVVIYFIIIFFVLKLIYIILSVILKGVNKIPVVGKLNKVLGAMLGCVNAILISVLIGMLLTLPIFKNGKEIKDKTVLKYTDGIAQRCFVLIENKLSNK